MVYKLLWILTASPNINYWSKERERSSLLLFVFHLRVMWEAGKRQKWDTYVDVPTILALVVSTKIVPMWTFNYLFPPRKKRLKEISERNFSYHNFSCEYLGGPKTWPVVNQSFQMLIFVCCWATTISKFRGSPCHVNIMMGWFQTLCFFPYYVAI